MRAHLLESPFIEAATSFKLISVDNDEQTTQSPNFLLVRLFVIYQGLSST